MVGYRKRRYLGHDSLGVEMTENRDVAARRQKCREGRAWILADLTLLLAAVHLGGVLTFGCHRENPASPMPTGEKRAPEQGGRA